MSRKIRRVRAGRKQDLPDDTPSAGTGAETASAGGRSVVVDERVVARDCDACGRLFRPARRGRPARYCSPACRQRGWALRQAEHALGTPADRRPAVVREVVERVLQPERRPLAPTPPAPVAAGAASRGVPTRAREWVRLLEQLADQLGDESSPMAREHWDHRRLHSQLERVLVQLAKAHPGGLEHLLRRR
jgi:hypothetical protein